MKYKIVRTDKADEGVRRIILYIAQNFGENAALEALDEMEKSIHALTENPYLGTTPKYMLLKRQGYRILVTKKGAVAQLTDQVGRSDSSFLLHKNMKTLASSTPARVLVV